MGKFLLVSVLMKETRLVLRKLRVGQARDTIADGK